MKAPDRTADQSLIRPPPGLRIVTEDWVRPVAGPGGLAIARLVTPIGSAAVSHREALFDAALHARLVGVGIYLLFRFTGWPKRKEPEEERPGLSREEMIEGLQAMIDDPDTSDVDRQKARDRLEAVRRLDR
jgi:hypothetical protein